MAQKQEFIECHVPDGFPAMSRPVDPAARMPESNIELTHWDENDLTTVAKLLYTCFPGIWWDKHEDAQTRPSLEVRVQRIARRMRPWVHDPGFHGIKAVHKPTGKFMGFAGWHFSGKPGDFPTTYPDLPGEWPSNFRPGMFRRDIWSMKSFDLLNRCGVTQAEADELWTHVGPTFGQEFADYDVARRNEVGDEPHWYLAPLAVFSEFRGQGVGKLLLDWAIKQADATSPPTPLVLEALPNARPVYLHMGFVGTESHGKGKDSQVVRRGPRVS